MFGGWVCAFWAEPFSSAYSGRRTAVPHRFPPGCPSFFYAHPRHPPPTFGRGDPHVFRLCGSLVGGSVPVRRHLLELRTCRVSIVRQGCPEGAVFPPPSTRSRRPAGGDGEEGSPQNFERNTGVAADNETGTFEVRGVTSGLAPTHPQKARTCGSRATGWGSPRPKVGRVGWKEAVGTLSGNRLPRGSRGDVVRQPPSAEGPSQAATATVRGTTPAVVRAQRARHPRPARSTV